MRFGQCLGIVVDEHACDRLGIRQRRKHTVERIELTTVRIRVTRTSHPVASVGVALGMRQLGALAGRGLVRRGHMLRQCSLFSLHALNGIVQLQRVNWDRLGSPVQNKRLVRRGRGRVGGLECLGHSGPARQHLLTCLRRTYALCGIVRLAKRIRREADLCIDRVKKAAGYGLVTARRAAFTRDHEQTTRGSGSAQSGLPIFLDKS